MYVSAGPTSGPVGHRNDGAQRRRSRRRTYGAMILAVAALSAGALKVVHKDAATMTSEPFSHFPH